MDDAQIKHMVDRFLTWRLPSDFMPDNGISYTRPNYAPQVDATPVGTNLLTATQATAMVRFMMQGLARSDPGAHGKGALREALRQSTADLSAIRGSLIRPEEQRAVAERVEANLVALAASASDAGGTMPPTKEAALIAERFHETYERLAPQFSYETRKASAKPWADVPENNKALMTAVCAELMSSGLRLAAASPQGHGAGGADADA